MRESGCHLFTLLGSAGVGKSRLVAELLAGVGDEVLVLRGRCLQLRGGDHVLAARGGTRPVGEPAAAVLERLTVGGAAVPGGAVLGRPAAARGARCAAPDGSVPRRSPMVRGDAARSDRSRRRSITRCADPGAVHRAPGAARGSPQLGRRKVQRADRPAGATGRSRVAERCSTSSAKGSTMPLARASSRRERGQPAVPGGDRRARARERRGHDSIDNSSAAGGSA